MAIRKGNKHQLGLFFLLEACQRNVAGWSTAVWPANAKLPLPHCRSSITRPCCSIWRSSANFQVDVTHVTSRFYKCKWPPFNVWGAVAHTYLFFFSGPSGRMARRSNQNSIRSSPSSPSIRSKSDGAGPGVRSTVMYGAFGRTRSRVSLFKFLSLFEWFVQVVLFELLFQCSRWIRYASHSLCKTQIMDEAEKAWRKVKGDKDAVKSLVEGQRKRGRRSRSEILVSLCDRIESVERGGEGFQISAIPRRIVSFGDRLSSACLLWVLAVRNSWADRWGTVGALWPSLRTLWRPRSLNRSARHKVTYKCLQRRSTQQLGLKTVTRTTADSNKEARAQQLEQRNSKTHTRLRIPLLLGLPASSWSNSSTRPCRPSLSSMLCYLLRSTKLCCASFLRSECSFNVRQLNQKKQLKQATRTKRLEQRRNSRPRPCRRRT